MTRIRGKWVTEPATQGIFDVLSQGGFRAWFVGGCVRNALLGEPVGDIDIATDAHPDDVTRLCETAGLKVVPTGYDHGTVTVVAGHIGHEITTLRKDVETDGRRAVVHYSDNLEDDARRRDFTMNALYAEADGTLVDPLGGLPDLRSRRVVFIEDAEDRIREDYLRILRFFRFHAWYGDPATGMDPGALAAISANLGGLETLSPERVGAELLKLLGAPDPAPAVATMGACGVLSRILPGAETAALPALVALEEGARPDPVARLAVLGGPDPAERLRLSRSQAKSWRRMRTVAESAEAAAVLGHRHGTDAATSGMRVRAALLGNRLPEGWRDEIGRGASAVFPIRAADLMPALTGPALGKHLLLLEEMWIASDFRSTRAELLAVAMR